jgi:hypothetical protein
MRCLPVSLAFWALLSFAAPAGASIVTYDAHMTFDPTGAQSAQGTGTITGTFAIDTVSEEVVAIDLTENTNNSSIPITPCCGFPSAESFTFTDLSLTTVSFGQQNDKFGGLPFAFVSTQSPCCLIDGFQGGPAFQFDFPYPQGGAVQPGNFDSTAEYNYLFGTVTPAVPEPSTWAMMFLGFTGLGFASLRRSRKSAATAG